MIYRTKLPLLLVPTLLAWASSSLAQTEAECSSDADCEEGSLCEKASYVEGCAPDAECDSTVHEEEFGRCVVQPTECSSDDDCGEYLTCSSSESGVCWSSSDGDSGCSEPDPDAPKYCAPEYAECSSDAGCPREFECVETMNCPTIDCAEGSDCEQPACEPSGGQCMPKQIECDDDSVCPSDWSCIKSVDYDCSGGGTGEVPPDEGGSDDPVAPTDGGSADLAPSPDPVDPVEEPEEPSCTEVTSQGYCQPDAWGGSFYGVDLGGEAPTVAGDGASKGESDSDDDDSESGSSSDAGGCSVHSTGVRPLGSFGWLAFFAVPLILSRRRRVASQRI